VRYRNVSIAGLGHELPPRVLTSSAIEDRLAPVYEKIGLVPGRLELMTGIRERRMFADGTRPSAIAANAGRMAIERSGVPKEAIGCLIHASVSRDFLEPATANVVHDRLGLRADAVVFDVSNACLGVMNGIAIIANMIELCQIDAGLVVAGEIGHHLVDATIVKLLAMREQLTRKSIKQSFASLTIGSGAAAVLLARSDLLDSGASHVLEGGAVRSATQHNALCRGGASDGGGRDTGVGAALDMATDAEALLEAGIGLARATFADCLEALAWSKAQIDRVVPHQVGRAHHKALLEALGLPEEKAYVTFDRFGNVGSVAVPLSLSLAAEEGFVARGQSVAMLAIGSGLSSVMLGIRW
jgi:acyl-CoA:acyl-CoA alkyltransferase